MTPANSLRIAIRAWIANGSPATIEQIIAAHPGYSVTRIQRAVALLVRHGDIASTGCNAGAYYSVTRKRLQQAESNRQDAIDYILEHAGALSDEIASVLGWSQAACTGRLSSMCERGELSREPIEKRIINKNGNTAVIRTFAYTALVEKTKSAAEVTRDLTANLGVSVQTHKATRKPSHKPVSEPGRYVHEGSKRTDLKNQRGQGAVRPSPRRGCSLGGF